MREKCGAGDNSATVSSTSPLQPSPEYGGCSDYPQNQETVALGGLSTFSPYCSGHLPHISPANVVSDPQDILPGERAVLGVIVLLQKLQVNPDRQGLLIRDDERRRAEKATVYS